jgi:hypothetical protein
MSVEAIENGVSHAHEQRGHVEVLYNGLTRRVDFQFTESMGALRQQAVNAFGNPPTPHALSLFTKAGTEFGPNTDTLTVREAGVKDGEELLLRPGIVRGG